MKTAIKKSKFVSNIDHFIPVGNGLGVFATVRVHYRYSEQNNSIEVVKFSVKNESLAPTSLD
jgi:hypothetical protein